MYSPINCCKYYSSLHFTPVKETVNQLDTSTPFDSSWKFKKNEDMIKNRGSMFPTIMLIQAGLSLLSRLSRLARVDSDRLNRARNVPSTAPSATVESRERASKLHVSRLLLLLPEMMDYGSDRIRIRKPSYLTLEMPLK